MRKILVFAVILAALQCACAEASAQEKSGKEGNGIVGRLVHLLFHPDVKYDTLYIGRPWGNWAFSLNENMMQHHYNLVIDGKSNPISNELTTSTGIGVAYRGVGAVVSVNFKKVNGKTDDKDFGLRLLGNRFSTEIRSFNVGNLRNTRFDTEMSGNNHLKGVSVNFYYTFNNKRFSYPAGFSFSKVQKRSAGSVIAIMSFYHDDLWLGHDDEFYQNTLALMHPNYGQHAIPRDSITDVLSGGTTRYLSLGAGYAYNWVLKSWLIHVSIEPSLMVWNKRTVSVSDVHYSRETNAEKFDIEIRSRDYRVPYSLLDFCCSGMASISYSWKRGYVAAYYTTTMSHISLRDMDEIIGGKSRSIYRTVKARLCIGCRF